MIENANDGPAMEEIVPGAIPDPRFAPGDIYITPKGFKRTEKGGAYGMKILTSGFTVAYGAVTENIAETIAPPMPDLRVALSLTEALETERLRQKVERLAAPIEQGIVRGFFVSMMKSMLAKEEVLAPVGFFVPQYTEISLGLATKIEPIIAGPIVDMTVAES